MSAPVEGLHVILGAGPVGRAVAAELLRHPGTRVRLVSRAGRGASGAEGVAVDLSDTAATISVCDSARTVTFAAAPSYTRWPAEFPALQDAAIRGAGEAGAILVAVENLYGYGRAGTLRETDPLTATTRKGQVRAEMTAGLMAAHQDGRVRVVAMRAADLFGPDMAVSALGDRVWPALIAGRPVGWIGDPDAIHTFTFLPDYARALVRAGAEPAAWGRVWHAPSPPDRTPREVLECAAGLLGTPPPRIRRTPRWALAGLGLVSPLLREVAEMAYQFEAPFQMDHSAWKDAFGCTPTPWEDALRDTLAGWGAEGLRDTA